MSVDKKPAEYIFNFIILSSLCEGDADLEEEESPTVTAFRIELPVV